MSEIGRSFHQNQPPIIHIPHRPRINSQRVKPTDSSNLLQRNVGETRESLELQTFTSTEEVERANAHGMSSPMIQQFPAFSHDEGNGPKKKKKTTKTSSKCCSSLTSKQKFFLKLFVFILVLMGITAAVVTPVYLFVIQQPDQQSSFSNLTASVCSKGTCIGQITSYPMSQTTVVYPFDGNPSDLSGYAIGIAYNFLANSYTLSSYVGTGTLSLTTTGQQYVQIPALNLSQSFTIEVWLYPSSLALAESGIFSQCDSSSNCLAIGIRASRFILSFDSMNNNNNTLITSNTIQQSTWVHLAIVYDTVLSQQLMYINGRIEAVSKPNIPVFKGSAWDSITTIGRTVWFAYGATYFQGRIDHFIASPGTARTACQLLNDASLLAYYPFDDAWTYNDYSVNLFHGVTSGVKILPQGPSGQALYFSSNSSYFQARCFPNPNSGSISYTFSLWVNPDSPVGRGSLIHASDGQDGTGSNCYDLLTLTSTGSLVIQFMQSSSVIIAIQGPMIPTNTWTHIAIVYGPADGLRLLINGQISSTPSSLSVTLSSAVPPLYITLGNNSPLGPSGSISCRNGTIPIVPGPYKGAIDEFRLYNRALTIQEICVLANM